MTLLAFGIYKGCNDMPKMRTTTYQGKRIMVYYDRGNWNTWVAFRVDEKGNQIAEADYDNNMAGAIKGAAVKDIYDYLKD